MSNNSKILVVLIFISLSLGFYVLFSLNKIDIHEQATVKVAHKVLDLEIKKKNPKEYSDNFELYLAEANLMVKNFDNISEEKIDILKAKILNLKSPDKKYQKNHLNLILSLDKLKDYLKDNNQEDYEKSVSFLEIANLNIK